MNLELTGKCAVVTGASKGIGRAIALRLAEEGAHVAICARDESTLRATEKDLSAHGTKVWAGTCDVGQAEAIEKFLTSARQALGRVDILINNASAFGMTDDENGWNSSFQVDLMAAVRGMWTVVPWMRETGGGAIVQVGSVAALEAGWGAAYSAAKVALISHAKNMALTLAPQKIRVNVVAPGSIEFPGGIWDQARRENRAFYDSVLGTIPSGRMGTAEEVADAAVFLASPRASWITGACLTVDGGQHRGIF
jgi:3-oxoacyl-[acyl-carrier protein] reductase